MSDIGSELQTSELSGLPRRDVALAVAIAACERLAPVAAAVLGDGQPKPGETCAELWATVERLGDGAAGRNLGLDEVRAAARAALDELDRTGGPLGWLPMAWLIAVLYSADYAERGDPVLLSLAVGQASEASEAWSERWMHCRGFDSSSPEWRAEKYSFDVVVAEAGWQRLDLAIARLDRVPPADRIATLRSRAQRAGAWLVERLEECRRECL